MGWEKETATRRWPTVIGAALMLVIGIIVGVQIRPRTSLAAQNARHATSAVVTTQGTLPPSSFASTTTSIPQPVEAPPGTGATIPVVTVAHITATDGSQATFALHQYGSRRIADLFGKFGTSFLALIEVDPPGDAGQRGIYQFDQAAAAPNGYRMKFLYEPPFGSLVTTVTPQLLLDVVNLDGNPFYSVLLSAGTNLLYNPASWFITTGAIDDQLKGIDEALALAKSSAIPNSRGVDRSWVLKPDGKGGAMWAPP